MLPDEADILNTKHKKLSVDGVQLPHPNNIKENWIAGNEYLPNIILNNIDESAELNSGNKASKEERKFLFSRQIIHLSLIQSLPT